MPTTNEVGFETPPPGVGFDTVTAIVAFAATSAATTGTLNCVALTKVVAREMPLKATDELAMKFVPFTSSTPLGGSAFSATFPGLSELIVGTGFEAALMVNTTAFDGPPPGAGE